MKIKLLKISKNLEPFFKNLPPFSHKTKNWFYRYLSIVALIVGILFGLYALSFWQTGHTSIIGPNTTYTQSGLPINPIYNLNIFYYINFILLLVNTVIFIVAYFSLRSKTDNGWLTVFSGLLVYVLYGVFALFSPIDGGLGAFIMTLIFCFIGFYILYQIKPLYTVKLKAKKVKTKKTK
jgi:hypothetical protein